MSDELPEKFFMGGQADPEYILKYSLVHQHSELSKENARLRAENEKLRHMLDAETDQAREDVVYFDELRAENERLQAKCEFIYDELLEAKGQVEKLRAALKPLADEVEYVPSQMDDDDWYEMDTIKVGHIRAAAAALKETGDE